jgi:hypothetical protein
MIAAHILTSSTPAASAQDCCARLRRHGWPPHCWAPVGSCWWADVHACWRECAAAASLLNSPAALPKTLVLPRTAAVPGSAAALPSTAFPACLDAHGGSTPGGHSRLCLPPWWLSRCQSALVPAVRLPLHRYTANSYKHLTFWSTSFACCKEHRGNPQRKSTRLTLSH